MPLFCPLPRPPTSTLFPYTTLFRSVKIRLLPATYRSSRPASCKVSDLSLLTLLPCSSKRAGAITMFSTPRRSEEHTSELQSLRHLVCRLLLEKKNGAHPVHPRRSSC